MCDNFLSGHTHSLHKLDSGTLYLPNATSLRMGPLGYQSDAQASLAVSFNCLDSYSRSLSRALSEPYPAYEQVGIHDGNGLYRQLATTLLQIENEFYGTIRPKRTIRSGERPLHALAERGVEYVEVRCLDLDPFSPIGIELETLRFLDVFLLHCLLSESPHGHARRDRRDLAQPASGGAIRARAGAAAEPRRRRDRPGRLGQATAARVRADRGGARCRRRWRRRWRELDERGRQRAASCCAGEPPSG